MGIDKNILRQFINLCQESENERIRIGKLEQEIDAMEPMDRCVSDVVTKGKRGKKPLGICTVHGNNDNSLINRKREKLRERKAKKELHLVQINNMIIDAEEFIYSVDDSELRRIMIYSCIEQKSWNEVAEAMGEGYTPEACKQKFSRFMRTK